MFLYDFLVSIWNYFAAFCEKKPVIEETGIFDPREKIYENYMSEMAITELNDISSYIEKKKDIYKEKCKLR